MTLGCSGKVLIGVGDGSGGNAGGIAGAGTVEGCAGAQCQTGAGGAVNLGGHLGNGGALVAAGGASSGGLPGKGGATAVERGGSLGAGGTLIVNGMAGAVSVAGGSVAGGNVATAGTVGTGAQAGLGGGLAAGGSATLGGAPNIGLGGAAGGLVNAGGTGVLLDIDQFQLSDAPSTPPFQNLADGMHLDAGALLTRATPSGCNVLTTPRALKVSANFSFWYQSVAIEEPGPVTTTGEPLDLTASTLSAWICLESGLSPYTTGDAPGGVVFYAKSGSSYAWGQAPWYNIASYGTWARIKLNMDTLDAGSSTAFDPSNVVQIGLQFSSGSGGTHCPDTASPDFQGSPTPTCPAWDAPLPTVIYVDSIRVFHN